MKKIFRKILGILTIIILVVIFVYVTLWLMLILDIDQCKNAITANWDSTQMALGLLRGMIGSFFSGFISYILSSLGLFLIKGTE